MLFLNSRWRCDAEWLLSGRSSLHQFGPGWFRRATVALEEVVHFVTQATDNSRDLQNYLLDLAVKLGRSQGE